MAETEIVVAFQVGTTTIESRIYQAGDVFGALPSEEGVYHWYLGNGEEILPTTAVPLKNVVVWGSQFALRVTQPVPLNVSSDSIAPILHMVQGDSNSRVIAASLWDGGSPFTPAGVMMLRFAKPDGTGGLYDKSEGGEPIRTFENGVSIPVAAQMLAVAGMVYCELDLYGGGTGTAAERLATFRFVIDVKANVYPDAQIISSDYYNILASDIAAAKTSAANAQKSAAAAAKSAASAATSVEGAVKYNVAQALTTQQLAQAQQNIGVTWACNPNLLVNWYFPNPVNQRRQAEYTGSGSSNVYGIDRWAVQFDGTKYNVANATLSSTSETNVGQMNYMLPNNEAMQFVEKQMTFSLLVDNPDGVNVTLHVRDRMRWSHLLPAKTGGGSLITTTGVFGTLNSGEGVQASFYIPHGTSIVPIAAKLELGGVQTLAHQDADGNWLLNEIPSYAEQVSRCQRYLIPLSSYQCPASNLEANAILFFVPLPVTMRALPTIKQNGFQVLSKSGEAQTGFTFSVSSLRSNGVIISAAKTGHGMTDAVLSAGTLSLLSAEL